MNTPTIDLEIQIPLPCVDCCHAEYAILPLGAAFAVYEYHSCAYSCVACRELSTYCECCRRCRQTRDDCTCCTICDSTDRDSCGCCTRCERTESRCTCCSACDNAQDDCTCCSICEGTDRDSCGCCHECDRMRDECTYCSDCDSHDCSCNEDSEGFSARPGRPWLDGTARLVGLEVEYNRCDDNYPLIRFCDVWRAGNHEDGSCGHEIVTAPISGKHIADCVKELGAAFIKANATADEKCGVHVHVDARDLRWEDIYRLVKVYAHVEPLLYLLAGQHRVANQYCAPTGKKYADALMALDRKDRVLGVAYDTSSGRMRSRSKPGKKDGGRYKGLNICPWLAGRRRDRYRRETAPEIKRDTTVEFRLHRNTLDPSRLIGWATLLARLVSWVSTASHRDAEMLPKSPLRALCTIAPESKAWILKRVKEWREATSIGRRGNRRVDRRISVGRFTGGYGVNGYDSRLHWASSWAIKGGE